MSEAQYPDYELLSQALQHPGQPRVSQLHGMLCGLLACSDVDGDSWLSELQAMESAQVVSPVDAEAKALLVDLQRASAVQLRDPQLGFELCLPDDEYKLLERTGALARWCEGFLYGVGIARVPGEWLQGESSREFLQDLSEIAQATPEQDDETEEAAFAELVEYVRVGVMLLSAEIDAHLEKSTLH